MVLFSCRGCHGWSSVGHGQPRTSGIWHSGTLAGPWAAGLENTNIKTSETGKTHRKIIGTEREDQDDRSFIVLAKPLKVTHQDTQFFVRKFVKCYKIDFTVIVEGQYLPLITSCTGNFPVTVIASRASGHHLDNQTLKSHSSGQPILL